VSKVQPDDPVAVRSTRRWQQVGVWLLLILVLSFPLYKLTEGSRRASAATQQQQAQIVAGTQLWAANCAVCHGPMGEGGSAPALNSQEFLTTVTDAQIRDIMRGGIPGTEMPAWLSDYGGPLTEEQIQALVVYIRSWEPTAPPRPDWRTPSGG
jgi:mono/diheme cytochrome c family protein